MNDARRGGRRAGPRPVWSRALGATLVVVVIGAAAACAPPSLSVTSPYRNTSTQGLDGRWEGNLLACTSGGGPVTAGVVNSGFDAGHPYLVQIFDGWDATPSKLVASRTQSNQEESLTSPPFAVGACFRVRISQPTGTPGQFTYQVTWCSGSCTTVPTAPKIKQFSATGGPFTDPALVPLTWEFSDPNPDDPLTCRLDIDDDLTWDVTITDCPRSGGRNISPAVGSHVVRLSVSDGTHPPVEASTTLTVGAGPAEPYDIEVVPAATGDPVVDGAVDAAVSRWERVIIRGVPDESVSSAADACGPATPFDGVVDDIAINVLVGDIDGQGGIAGEAAPCVHAPDGLPRYAFVRIDSADLPFLITYGLLADLVAHEIGHALGVGGQRWGALLNEFAGPDPEFGGPRAVVEYSVLGGTGWVPTEWPGDHWRESVFGPELMTPNLGAVNPLSALTVAALADVGYHVDPTAAEAYVLPTTAVLDPSEPEVHVDLSGDAGPPTG